MYNKHLIYKKVNEPRAVWTWRDRFIRCSFIVLNLKISQNKSLAFITILINKTNIYTHTHDVFFKKKNALHCETQFS